MRKVLITGILVACMALCGCAKTMTSTMNQLTVGQSLEEVKSFLGTPTQSGGEEGVLIYKYNTFKPFSGVIPYYLYFAQDDKGIYRLMKYGPNMDEYWQTQRAWMGVAGNLQQQVIVQQAAKAAKERQLQEQAQQSALIHTSNNLPKETLSPGQYNIYVSRVSDNVYEAKEGLIIITKMCMKLSMGEEAVLNYTSGNFNNELIFMNGPTSCQVKEVYSK